MRYSVRIGSMQRAVVQMETIPWPLPQRRDGNLYNLDCPYGTRHVYDFDIGSGTNFVVILTVGHFCQVQSQLP